MSKGFAPIIIILGIVLLLGIAGGAYYLVKSQAPGPQPEKTATISPAPQVTAFPSSIPTPTPVETTSSPTSVPVVEEQFCGGFAGKLCPSGYTCKLDGNYPDAGGKCVKD